MFRALLLSVRYHLPDAKPAEGLDGRASFRHFGGFSHGEKTRRETERKNTSRAQVSGSRIRSPWLTSHALAHCFDGHLYPITRFRLIG